MDTDSLMPSDFEQWQKDSPYGVLASRTNGRTDGRHNRPQSCPESQRCFEEPKAHLFGVCCIIRTRELATRESLLSIPFFLSFFPDLRGKQVLEIYYMRGAKCAVGRVRAEAALLRLREKERERDTSANTQTVRREILGDIQDCTSNLQKFQLPDISCFVIKPNCAKSDKKQ